MKSFAHDQRVIDVKHLQSHKMLGLYLSAAAVFLILLHYYVLEPLLINPKSKIPGPKLYALTKWRLALDDWRGERTRSIDRLHRQYGHAVRIGPNEIHFNSLNALQKIYGAGSGYERTFFYNMFDVYGRQNLFTFHSSKQHGERKKMLANAYSKSSMLKAPMTEMIEKRVDEYMDLLAATHEAPVDAFKTLHYFSIDSITHFLYGSNSGGTSALLGNPVDRALLNDILDPARRTLSWFAIHHPKFTKWLYTRTHTVERLLRPLLPMQKPATYTGIRAHALKAYYDSRAISKSRSSNGSSRSTVIGELFSHASVSSLDDLDIASECADHLLAGIDTTADTLMFVFWALSLPENKHVQERLIGEIRSMLRTSNGRSLSLVEASEKLSYLDAVIKESLRLYAPLPASEPRTLPNTASVIDGYEIPAGTIVGMAPYGLHRLANVFEDPLVFKPDRWLEGDVATMNRYFWAFSSGGRMCIGKNLAQAEMTTLVAAVYAKYTTGITPGFEGKSPAITSRMELFYDETMPAYEVVCHGLSSEKPADRTSRSTYAPSSSALCDSTY